MTRREINRCIRLFVKGGDSDLGRHRLGRYASFDYCFNFFRGYYTAGQTTEMASGENIEASCLHLGFYLASWGMLRPSSHLLQRSAKYYETVIRKIAEADVRLWSIDANAYGEENIRLLLGFSEQLRTAFDFAITDTLVTKIMLGAFGNVPAFDQRFCTGMKMYTFGRQSLHRLAEFYDEHHAVIDRYHQRLHTLDFATGRNTHLLYTRAKIIDMIGFIKGGESA